jgi:uncharacterized membrane protein
MNKWSLLGAAIFGGLFALFLLWPALGISSPALRVTLAVFLLGFYCTVVVFGVFGKRRTVSWAAQTLLGVLAAVSIGALFGVSPVGYAVAVVLGLVLGATAHWWAEHVLNAA